MSLYRSIMVGIVVIAGDLCIFCCVLISGSFGNEHSCPSDDMFYDNNTLSCRWCTICEPGFGKRRQCGPFSDTYCERCADGFYSDTWSTDEMCKPCSFCPNRRYKRNCAVTRNSICGDCSTGYYENEAFMCRRCQQCPVNDASRFNVTKCYVDNVPYKHHCKDWKWTVAAEAIPTLGYTISTTSEYPKVYFVSEIFITGSVALGTMVVCVTFLLLVKILHGHSLQTVNVKSRTTKMQQRNDFESAKSKIVDPNGNDLRMV
ncbi:uncharacterized protein LOC141906052 [Tubulanus polymorphus]|uniref:uncharacterized protein LOC141906052 n=1 Tax=Tubulanus polymorphus TaxID=672921 RepID=UPI003DA54372